MFYVRSKGHFSGPFGSGIKNADIPLSCIDKKYHSQLEKSYCVQPIITYVDLLKGPDRNIFEEPWSPDLVAYVGAKIYE